MDPRRTGFVGPEQFTTALTMPVAGLLPRTRTTSAGVVLKLLTCGLANYATQRWELLDTACLLCTFAKLILTRYRRTLLSFSSLRVFMLLSRFRELKQLTETILLSLPNVVITMASLLVIWLMFAVVGVALFGGATHQCAAVHSAQGYPGCGVAEGASRDPSLPWAHVECRYARAPLPVPSGVFPGVTNSSDCGCTWLDGENVCAPITVDGVELAWVPSFPSYDTTPRALLALFQVSTLDGWHNLLHFGLDVSAIDVQPSRERQAWAPALFYLIFIVFGSLFATNVFVGVVIDEFQKVKRVYEGSAALTEEQITWVNTQKLMCRLTSEKVNVLEPPGSRPRQRFCFRLVYDDEANGRPTNAPVGAEYHGRAFERAVFVAICLNVIALMLYSDPLDAGVSQAYEALNYFFVLVFAIEAGVRITASTFPAYIRSGWNRFDFFLVVFSVAASAAVLIGDAAGYDVANRAEMRWLRCVRALRIVRLARVSPAILKMMRTMLYASPSICNITFGIFLFTFVYAQFGMSLLGTLLYEPDAEGISRHANFETVFRAFSALVRMATADSWSLLLADAVHNPHASNIAPPPLGIVYFFFVFYMAFMGWVLISIFIAIILDYFNESNADDKVAVRYDDIEAFQRKWLEFDVSNTSFIKTNDLGLLLYSCKPPLVGVRERGRDGLFDAGSAMTRPNLRQLQQILVELDLPEHDGRVHFLEVVLCLLQRLTGVISEEQIMSQLMSMHPRYVNTVKQMASITGSTADPYVADEIMAHLRRGLEQTGLLAEAEGEARPKPDAPTEKKARRASNIVRSITRRRASRDHDQEREAREREAKRNCLSRFASTNMASRAATFGESGRSTPGYASTPGCASASRSDGSPTPMGAAARSPPQQRAGRNSVQFADSVVDELCA